MHTRKIAAGVILAVPDALTVRISKQTRAWVKDSWRLGQRAW